jgi:hypothetical protein
MFADAVALGSSPLNHHHTLSGSGQGERCCKARRPAAHNTDINGWIRIRH